MSNFPLYSIISFGIPTKDLTSIQKNDFIKKIGIMEEDGHELIFALIKTYYIENSNDSPFIIPYGGKSTSEDMIFNLDDIPITLRQILYKFSKIHLKKMKEDQKLAENRTPKK